MEACVSAIRNDQGDPDRAPILLGLLRHTLDRGALAIRQGNRVHVLDRLVRDLDQEAAQLDVRHAAHETTLITRPHDWQA